MARLVDRAFENPANSGGLMVVALTATAIVSNAMFLQNGHHPDPLFSTRPTVQAPRPRIAPASAPLPVARPDAIPEALVIPPLPRPSPARTQATAVATSAGDAAAQLTTQIQRQLARLGLYTGTIDGMTGARTSAAIVSFERAAGLAVTGKPTQALLDLMSQPVPRQSIPPASVRDNESAAALQQREAMRAKAIAEEQQAHAALQMHQNYRAVQDALNRIGYGPMKVDGEPNTETADAIRRFELDNGLPISGEVDDALIGHLIEIGAIDPA